MGDITKHLIGAASLLGAVGAIVFAGIEFDKDMKKASKYDYMKNNSPALRDIDNDGDNDLVWQDKKGMVKELYISENGKYIHFDKYLEQTGKSFEIEYTGRLR